MFNHKMWCRTPSTSCTKRTQSESWRHDMPSPIHRCLWHGLKRWYPGTPRSQWSQVWSWFSKVSHCIPSLKKPILYVTMSLDSKPNHAATPQHRVRACWDLLWPTSTASLIRSFWTFSNSCGARYDLLYSSLLGGHAARDQPAMQVVKFHFHRNQPSIDPLGMWIDWKIFSSHQWTRPSSHQKPAYRIIILSTILCHSTIQLQPVFCALKSIIERIMSTQTPK